MWVNRISDVLNYLLKVIIPFEIVEAEEIKPQHNKTNKMTCAPSEGSDQPGWMPRLIRVFAVRMKKCWDIGYPESAQRRL